MRRKIRLRIEEEANKALSLDIWEIRIILRGNNFRILGFWDSPNQFILTNAFHKKTQKIPQQAIKLAEDRKRDYFSRRCKK